MKFAIFGAGAIGGFVGARLIESGEDAALIARGSHLKAIQDHGLTIRSQTFGESVYKPHATDDPAEIGPVDAVLLAVKAQATGEAARRLGPLLGPDTCVVTMQNGIPWWYFEGLEGKWKGSRLESVDPGGLTARHIDVRRVVGCIVYCSAILAAPGIIEHLSGEGGDGLALGEPDGSRSERVRRLARVFAGAGFRAPVRTDLRREIWVKLLGNAPFNPITALTGATLAGTIDYPLTRDLALEMMDEVRAVASALGVEIRVSNERRMKGARSVGHHKTSMLQDFEAGRPPELDPILGAVIELAEKTQVAVPHLRAVYACAKLAAERASRKRLSG